LLRLPIPFLFLPVSLLPISGHSSGNDEVDQWFPNQPVGGNP
jgi:hypothetical protein